METRNVKDVEVRTSLNGAKASLLYSTHHVQAIHIMLEPYESLKRHATPVDTLFYVLEGTGVVDISGEKQAVCPDALVNCPATAPHYWYNNGKDNLRVLVVKVPPSPRFTYEELKVKV